MLKIMNSQRAIALSQDFLKKLPITITREEVRVLEEVLAYHNALYYEKESPIISDFEYDQLFKLLKILEQRFEIIHPSSGKVGSEMKQSTFEKVLHSRPMISLDNTYNNEDLQEFDERIQRILSGFQLPVSLFEWKREVEYAMEFKFDGLGIELIYEKGNLKQAITRGNGIEWEDVTENIFTISNIPKTIPYIDTLEVRGEVVMPISSFQSLNHEAKLTGEKIFANPRNAASGSVRTLDTEVTRKRKLKFFAYDLANFQEFVEAEKKEFYFDVIKDLEKMGFEISSFFKTCSSIGEVMEQIDAFWDTKNQIDFEIDGLVIKLNDIHLWEKVGRTEHHPRYAIAYKFPAAVIRTVLLDIEHSVGRTGTITPVALLEPVSVGGVIVKRATLHNYEEVAAKDVRIWDQVFIKRAGEVIPEVIAPIVEVRNGKEKTILVPEVCPICKTVVAKEEGKVRFYCPNRFNCQAQVVGNIIYSVWKTGFNIDGLWEKQVELFYEKWLIKDIVDVFSLAEKKDIILTFEWFKEKSVSNLIESLEKAKKQSLVSFFVSLGIPWVGKKMAKIFSRLFDSKEQIINFSYTQEDIEKLHEVGPETSASIVKFFHENSHLIRRLLLVLDLEFHKGKELLWSHLQGKKLCITGSFEKYSRDDIVSLIEENGGEFIGSVSKNLDYLVAGESAGSKLEKAKSLGVEVLSLEKFMRLLEN